MTVLDLLEIERCVIAGESLGALTVATAVVRDPSRFSGLVIVDGAPSADRTRMQPLIDGSRSDFPATVQWFVDACVPEADSDHIRRWGRQILLRADPEAAARILEVHADGEVAPDFSQIEIPVLVIHGEADVIIPVQAAEMIAATTPNATLVRIPSAGHVPTLTRPAEVVRAIDDWRATQH